MKFNVDYLMIWHETETDGFMGPPNQMTSEYGVQGYWNLTIEYRQLLLVVI